MRFAIRDAQFIESGETKGTKQIVAQMENMSKPNQFASVEFNGDFFRFVTMSQGMLAFADPDVERQFLPSESDDTTLGQALRRSLGKSKSVSIDEFQRIFKSGQVQKVEKQNASFMMQTYGYKTMKAMLQHMKKCTVSDLPLKFHPAAIRASAIFEPPQVSGPSEARVFRLHSGRRAG
ncbi:CdiI family contact-dependent growth inhibition immunity protein [Agrobacterium tumefaciens]|uniref:contact-dependent growth inhibition system immunity protein n=1 Tax=Agrobacterium tumefaciens TaxID=358 RepID=UPI000CF1BCC7|nr:contact-dependent growth inhibition system immunity protein [Agrobacterium tumefaciens]NSY98265.1 CdiI family contact-dependent growth inhibition immunity protein [Agrobacterium tumefaciens]NSZ03289.1 CdiI family contact-dependent growth inhibition immunity protein [Agrobacterium tumefaciens]NSZ38505.1 CdiI family contact-dependent growth inhibition immunity protein [Agrobacterium tumefaciens]NTB04149.1 CdiI family contact-dependent growth inhibition immunity protein [Agrobacterium tumefacie